MRKTSLFFLCLYIFTLPSGGFFDFQYLGNVNVIFLIISLILFLISYPKDETEQENFLDFYFKRRYFLLICVFFLLVAISYVWSIAPDYTEIKIKASIQMVVATILMLRLVNSKKKTLLVIQFFFLGSFVSIFGIFYSFFFDKPFFQDTTRYTSQGLNPNDYGVIVALIIPLAWYLLTEIKSSTIKWSVLIFIPLSLISIFLTGSRGAFVSLLTALLIIPFSYIKISKFSKLFLIVAFIAVSFFVLFLIPGSTIDRVTNIYNSAQSDNLSKRIDIWNASKRFIPDKIFTGVGAGSFRTAIGNIMGREHVAHNTLLSILGEEGILGLCIFIIIIILLIFKISKLPDEEKKVWSIVLLTWFLGTSVMSWDFHPITWLIFSLIIASPSKKINQNDN
ncbi:MAG TPA: O-antigen ligase family protein [Candidatus Paceibacterota bacterium]|nr:O-antigen ligase family protein [Candidatus Paceibacterota bacterium]